MQQIFNFFQITNTIATSGQPKTNQFQIICDAGFQTVINLAMPDSDEAIHNEGQLVTQLGMNYFHIPVPFDKPSKTHLELFFNILNSLEKSENNKIWVHCVVNARVSAFMFQYLTQMKHFSDEDATSPILKKWLPSMDENWKGFMAIKI